MSYTIIIAAIGSLLAGFIAATLIARQREKRQVGGLIADAKKEAEALKKEKILQAKERFIELKSEHEKTIQSRERKMGDAEKRIKDKESKVNKQLEEQKRKDKDLQRLKERHERQMTAVDSRLAEIEKNHR